MESKRFSMSQSAGSAAGERSVQGTKPALEAKTESCVVEQTSRKDAEAMHEAKGDSKRAELKQAGGEPRSDPGASERVGGPVPRAHWSR